MAHMFSFCFDDLVLGGVGEGGCLLGGLGGAYLTLDLWSCPHPARVGS